MHALSGMLYMLTKVWLNYRIQGKFSRYIRWGGSVAPKILRVFAQDVLYGMKAYVLWKRWLVNDLSMSAMIKPVVNAD